MGDKARQYKPTTVRRLDTLSGNQCAAPDCENTLIAHDYLTIISQISHIEAASENGPRFNPDMTDDDRRHYNNLLLLCIECHKIVDNKENEHLFPVVLLKEWKSSHEGKQLEKLSKNTSLLKQAINIIASANFEDYQAIASNQPAVFDIENKIEYNNIIRNRYLIEEYRAYYTKISALYLELESQGSFKKDSLLRNIRQIYLQAKGKFIASSENEIESLRSNADNIIEDIEETLFASCETQQGIAKEDISFGIAVIMVDAFMRCKILEAPPGL